MAREWQEKLAERLVTYTLEWEGKFYIVENVPARIDEETGERYFSPETVEHLQQLIWAHHEPTRIAEIPVYDFAA